MYLTNEFYLVRKAGRSGLCPHSYLATLYIAMYMGGVRMCGQCSCLFMKSVPQPTTTDERSIACMLFLNCLLISCLLRANSKGHPSLLN